MEDAANVQPQHGIPRAVIAVGVGMVLILLAMWALPGLSAETDRQRESDLRVCMMSKTMADSTMDYDTAKLLCRQP